MTINASKGAVFDTLAALLLSLVVPIPEQPGAEGRSAWLSGPTAGVDQEVEVPGLSSCLWGVTVHCFTLKVLVTLM